MLLALMFLMIINLGELCECGEPINPYALQHVEGVYQPDDTVYINCNFCGASNLIEIIQVDDNNKPLIIRLPLPSDTDVVPPTGLIIEN